MCHNSPMTNARYPSDDAGCPHKKGPDLRKGERGPGLGFIVERGAEA